MSFRVTQPIPALGLGCCTGSTQARGACEVLGDTSPSPAKPRVPVLMQGGHLYSSWHSSSLQRRPASAHLPCATQGKRAGRGIRVVHTRSRRREKMENKWSCSFPQPPCVAQGTVTQPQQGHPAPQPSYLPSEGRAASSTLRGAHRVLGGPGCVAREKGCCTHPNQALESGQACHPLWHVSPGRCGWVRAHRAWQKPQKSESGPLDITKLLAARQSVLGCWGQQWDPAQGWGSQVGVLTRVAKWDRSSVPKPSTHPQGAGSQQGSGDSMEIPTVSSEEASPVALETLASVVLISHVRLLKQEDRAL